VFSLRYLLFLLIVVSCLPLTPAKLKEGDCVIGDNMVIWKLLRNEKGIYLFVDAPEREGSLIRTIKDISALKKVTCPK
jgi:hypothetical protein